jgi:hypothetical protein
MTDGYKGAMRQESYTGGTERGMIYVMQRDDHSDAVMLGEALDEG